MAIEHRLREAIDTFMARVRHDLDAHVRGLTSDIFRVIQDHQENWKSDLDRAVSDARIEAERNFRGRIETIRAEVTREVEARLAAERADLEGRMSAERAELTQRAAQERAELEARLVAERAEFASQLESRLTAERARLEAVWQGRLEQERLDMTARVASERARAVEVVRPAAPLPIDRAEIDAAVAAARVEMSEDRVEAFGRLLGSIRRIDAASSLTGILEALAKGAVAEASRVAILIVDGDMLRVWGHFGFAGGQGPFDMPLASSGVLSAAVALRQTSVLTAPTDGRDPTAPAFMRAPADHTGLVVPLVVGGEVVAVLYADGVARQPDEERPSVWVEEVELLVRHASLRLENVTSMRTVEVFTNPA